MNHLFVDIYLKKNIIRFAREFYNIYKNKKIWMSTTIKMLNRCTCPKKI